MLEAALFRHDGIPGDVLYLAHDRLSIEVGQLHAVGCDDGEVAIPQKEKIAGVIQNCRNIGGDEVFVFSQPDHGRRSIARGHNRVRFFHGDHCQGKHAGELSDGLADRLFQ